MKYTKEQKDRVLDLLRDPNSPSISKIAKNEGISPKTIYVWRSELRKQGVLLPGCKGTSKWTSRDKFMAVLETASMNQEGISQYCREKGMYPDDIKHWRQACEDANDWDKAKNKEIKKSLSAEKEKVRKLTKDRNRKERALAEAAALLVLQKKAQAIWGEEEE
jgi:transposase-like protein